MRPCWPVLDRKAQDALWITLAGPDAAAGLHAIRTLASAPEAAIAVGKRLRPIGLSPADRFQQLLADLQSNQFATREKAAAELEKLGDLIEPNLREVLTGKPPLEVRQRLEKLLERLVLTPLSPEQLRAVRIVEMLEQAATPAARQFLNELAGGAPSARQTREAKAALQRLSSVGP